MAIQYTNIPENDFGRGIDARSTENQIGEGFVKDLLNADVIQKSVRKRVGYESYAGNIPVRVTRLDYIKSKKQMCFTLDSVVSLNTAVSLESVRSSPLVVYGRSSNQTAGPVTSAGDSAHYYDKFLVPIRKEFVNPGGTLNIEGTEHGLGSTEFFCNIVESTVATDKSYEDIETNFIRIDNNTYDVNIDYSYEEKDKTDVIIYYKDESFVPASNYIHTFSVNSSTSDSHKETILREDHNLSNYNIIYQLYEVTTGEVIKVEPNLFVIKNNGDVEITINNDTGSTVEYRVILSASPTANITNGNVNGESIGTAKIINPTSPWVFYNIYLIDENENKEEVKAGSVKYNDDTKEITFTFENNENLAKDFIIYYQYGNVRSNVLCVVDDLVELIEENSTDLQPQITLWGLDHDEIYETKSAREGWTTHIDTYRRSGEQRVIAGLGGNIFSAQAYAEVYSIDPPTLVSEQYKYAQLYPSLQSRADESLTLGPVFYDTGDTPGRSRGYITSDNSGTNWVSVTSVEYETLLAGYEGTTKYTLHVPNMKLFNKDNSLLPTTTNNLPISTAVGLEDWLTVNNMSYKAHEGIFKVKKVEITQTDYIEIWVENPSNSSDYDDTGVGGYAGIFTDRIVWLSDCAYIPEDTLLLSGEDLATVYSSDDDTTICGPFDSIVEIAAGVLITGRRTSSVIPMREALPSLASSVENLVRGDMLSYTGISRKLRVLNINADSDREVSISGDGETALVTLASGDTSFLSKGQQILLIGANEYSGVQTIDEIPDLDTFTFKSTFVPSSPITAILSGKTIEIDESLEWADTSSDSNVFQVARRWIPIEAPDDEYDLTSSTYVRHFDSAQYSAQPFIRSTMVSDNLYLTNGSDEVMKFDGSNIYRAGLPAWQPGLFTTLAADPATRNCSLTNNSTTVTVIGGNTTEGIEVGVLVTGTHIPAGATVVSITDDTRFEISIETTGGGNSDVSFTFPEKIAINLRSIEHKGKVGSNTLELKSVWEDGSLPVGSKVRINGLTTLYTIQSYIEKGGTAYIQFQEKLEDAITSKINNSDVGDGIIQETGYYKYYLRLNAVDANNNIIASAMTSSDDMSITLSENAGIRLKLVGMPALDNYDYSRVELEIYRTRLLTGAVAPVFYKVTTLGSEYINFYNTNGYIEYLDTSADTDIALPFNLDKLSTQAGAELGIGWSAPLRAKYITTAANRLVLGNVRDYPEFDIQIDGITTLDSSKFNGDTLLFRKDFADTDSTTNVLDRIKFEWKNQFTGEVDDFSIGTDEFSFTTSTDTGAEPGDWIYLTYDKVLKSARNLKYSGWWQIKQVTPLPLPLIGDTITVNLTGASAATSYPNRYVIATNPTDVPVYLGTDGNLGQDNGDSGITVSGNSDIFDATRRLALAINSVMRMTDTTIPGMEEFRPWLIARSGNDVNRAGQIIVRSPRQTDTLPSIEADFDGYSLYVNSFEVESEVPTTASERVYPSRVLVSYENNPELFDTPTAILDFDSISAIDINPADGQEITGVIPFFGEAAFTAAQQAGILVVFKTNSIYLVDINQKVSGGNLVVQRLETQGLGCTAPYSIAVTKNGIVFANNSGMYCLRRNQTIDYIGKFMERNWAGQVEKDALSIAQGHHYGVGRMYKLSLPIVNTQDTATGYIEPSQVYVYNHAQEEEGQLGAWSRYDNHTAIGWANLASDAFWASTGGKVYALRATGTETDFRDSNEAIVFKLDTRPNSYGNSGIRKVLSKILANYRAGSATTNNNLYFSIDLEQEYTETTPFRIAGTNENLTGIDDLVQRDIITLTHNIGRRKGVYFSIRIENSSLDQNVEVAGLDYQVGALNSEGIKSAVET